jgi:Tfp pilus assembly protein PilP
MLKKNLLTIALLAVAAAAQTTPAKTSTATKPSTTPAKAATAPAKKATAPAKPSSQTTSAATSKAISKPVAPSKAPVTKAKAAPAPKPASPAKVKADIQAKVQRPAATKEAPVKTAGRRDPFISPLRLQEDKVKTSLCTTGARCLIIDQVVLKGIVKTQQGMIAMVENPAKKQYNLREKDPVFNGQVMKITGDSLIFRETVTDNLGHQTTREVVKRVTAPVI